MLLIIWTKTSPKALDSRIVIGKTLLKKDLRRDYFEVSSTHSKLFQLWEWQIIKKEWTNECKNYHIHFIQFIWLFVLIILCVLVFCLWILVFIIISTLVVIFSNQLTLALLSWTRTIFLFLSKTYDIKHECKSLKYKLFFQERRVLSYN